MKSREPRSKVMLKARMRVASAWHDACILNLSSRGLMLQTSKPPERNSYLEIRRGPHVIVARVMWSSGHRVGLKAQDELSIDDLVSEVEVRGGVNALPSERRRVPRPSPDRSERHRHWGRRVQYLAIALCSVAAAIIAAAEARQALATPLQAADAVLRPDPTRQ
ncbi:PilZ domain-containing protein [Sphingomonas sp. LY160]|uniref:PilZ domain-containing protein n=1 Tax=Sphingomonas sp. LY160 TaxID=3095342 RepID=UPI002ADEBCCF|nr:PilZ domain-containing protein [Sphingomonas sp. LY160]MEA1071601.1 hypothetical protein [Sphingomonas sp. LY160]